MSQLRSTRTQLLSKPWLHILIFSKSQWQSKSTGLKVKHPNPNLVNSVCHSLWTGFWPHTNTHHDTYIVTWDNSYHPIRTKAEQDFIESQIDKEGLSGRYSEDFGPHLLLGMYCSTIHTVPKLGTDTLYLMNDQSTGEFSLPTSWSVGFVMGIPRVRICHTITIPSDTTPVQGRGRNRTLIYMVSHETHSFFSLKYSKYIIKHY